MRSEAIYTFDTVCAKELYTCLLCEEAETDSISERSKISLELKTQTKLVLKIESRDPASLRAATNTWLRLIMTAMDVHDSLLYGNI